MKLLHIADLHLGKKMNGMNLKEDQEYWISSFLKKTDEIKPDAILIAGDVYDKAAPIDDAVALLDYFVSEISKRKIPLLMIAGNHDSGQKLSFANAILQNSNVYIEGVLKKNIKHVVFSDDYGPVHFWLLPYFFPALVKEVYNCTDIRDYDSACKYILDAQDFNFNERNILIAHQNITCNNTEAERDGSETSIGGLGSISYKLFDDFDYVALGHIHKAQVVGRNEVRYSGSPIPYHFYTYETTTADIYNDKGPLLVELNQKGDAVKIEKIDIPVLHKVRVLKGTIDELKQEISEKKYRNEYIKLIVTDTKITLSLRDDFSARIKEHGSDLAEMQYQSPEQKREFEYINENNDENKSMEELFLEFYSEMKEDEVLSSEEKDLFSYISQMIIEDVDNSSANTFAESALNYLLGEEDEE